MQKISAHSVSDVMRIVTAARREWHLPEDEELWFRGEDQKYESTTLQPKLYRHLPHTVRKASIALLRQERDFFDEFARRGLEIYGREADAWDWYFLMQHHSAPTRLLDWTDGGLTALHFANRGDLSKTEGGFVYVLDPFQLVDVLPSSKRIRSGWNSYRHYRKKKGRSSPGPWDKVYLPGHSALSKGSHKPPLPAEPMVLEFPQMTRRISAQHSRLIVMGTDRHWLRKWARRSDARIKRIEIPKTRMPAIRIQLRDAGVSESVIFPDLDGLGRELAQLWDQIKIKKRFNK
jgi:hypothetical protein